MACSLRFEKALRAGGCEVIAGIDEAGRGPLAGPVVVAAVILPVKFRHKTLNDSKQLSAKQRELIYDELTNHPEVRWVVNMADHEEVDRRNIWWATVAAMCRAAREITPEPQHVLIDGKPIPGFPFPQTALVGGDGRSFSIAAASVIAKVTRDRLMVQMCSRYPGYEFSQHKGYATALHRERLDLHGPCPIHRRSFLSPRQMALPFS